METIIQLQSHLNAKYHDHPFNSPTYQKVLIERIYNYFESQGRLT